MDHLSPGTIEIVFRLVVAMLAGMIVGFNRDLKDKPVGMRTLGLVSLSSALLIVSGSVYGGLQFEQASTSRVIQGIMTGLGFLGGGVILRGRRQEEIKGLTTAATVWLAAALGVTAGLGGWLITALGCAFALTLLVFGKPVEDLLDRMFMRRDGSNDSQR
ncbi:MgtC/SapB family protein [Microvirga puerhi]|uniref:Protein MgtC n=1 Tax=Microvirga puerhi TaxID=2876078 RepID=A0ABS7VMX8_9HYPH|nr:MgtC/SapB family protein [Microvirga puerhi]MBZ6076859.1 MgtC/SapB family protein [Microvirga puerhi]